MISVIVPVYNVEKYLDACINSIISQAYKDLEIILIDDGSTDSSGKICDQYAKKDSRIQVIHKKNNGVSSARNMGIDIAKGEYIAFVDSDDYIDIHMYETLNEMAVKTGADIVECDFMYRKCEKKVQGEAYTFSGLEVLKKLYSDNTEHGILSVSPCNKIFKRDVVSDIRFKVGCSIAEDRDFILRVLFYTKKIVKYNIPLYYYVPSEGSAMRGERILKKITDNFWIHKDMLDFCIEKQILGTAINLSYFIYQFLFNYSECYPRRKSKEFELSLKEMRTYIKSIRSLVNGSDCSKNLKFKVNILCISPTAFFTMESMYRKKNKKKK